MVGQNTHEHLCAEGFPLRSWLAPLRTVFANFVDGSGSFEVESANYVALA